IDLIITKTVSRFASNTVDSLTTIRKLKEKGVEVYFEEQNIYTLDSKGELLITIMSSFAQEEAHSISDNTKWGIHKRFEDGKVSVAYSRFLGFQKGPDGGLAVVPEEAVTVQQIYKWFLDGFSPYAIAKKLTEIGVLTPTGNEKWPASTVKSILQNEKYKGDALLQKQYTVDFLTKKRAKNDGSVLPQYYVEGDHEAIIDPETFELAQLELQRRRESRMRYSGVSIFSLKVKCGCCGDWYGKKVWHSTDKYKKYVYRCNNRCKDDKKCNAPTLTEDNIKEAFVSALNALIINRDSIADNLRLLVDDLEDTGAAEMRVKELETEVSVLDTEIKDLIEENAHRVQNQENYQIRYDVLASKFETAKQDYDTLEHQIARDRANVKILKQFIADLLNQNETVDEFDTRLWSSLVDFVTVYAKDDIQVTFKDGTEIQA
ncbi:MAG: recombinase family protein, partial [Oscillospiraceae bacterium]|nr:recombinase family protein [Oscillospiraceae bacterium]